MTWFAGDSEPPTRGCPKPAAETSVVGLVSAARPSFMDIELNKPLPPEKPWVPAVFPNGQMETRPGEVAEWLRWWRGNAAEGRDEPGRKVNPAPLRFLS